MNTKDSRLIKRAVYLNAAEISVLEERVEELRKQGSKAGQATILRGLMHGTAAGDMFALSVNLVAADALSAPSTGRTVAKRPTIVVTDGEWSKVGDVVERLARNGMTATHNLVLRALVRGAPSGRALLTLVEKFRADVPNKPRGLSKIRLGAKRKANG